MTAPQPARRVVVTGVGVVSPAGDDPCAHLRGLLAGQSKAREVRDAWFASFDRVIIASTPGAPPTGESAHVALGDRAVTQALHDAGLTDTERAGTGIVAATAIGASIELETAWRHAEAAPPEMFGFDLLANTIRSRHGLAADGWTPTVSTGCTAGLDALGTGFDAVVSGRQDRVVVVAADATACPIVVSAFGKIGALSSRPVPADQASCPFSADRDGFVLGDGAAAVVLEDYDTAVARGVIPGVEVAGWGSVSSAFHMTRIRPGGEDIAAAIHAALARAGLPADAIDVVDAHGTSTQINDAAESAAVHTTFGARADRIPVVAQKGVTGHALGASNLLEIAGLVAYLSVGLLPPVANTSCDSIDVPLDVVTGRARRAQPEWALKTSSGFSGIHTAAVLRRLR